MANKKQLILIIAIALVVIAAVVFSVTVLPGILDNDDTESIQGGEISGEMGIADSEFEDNTSALPPEYITTPSTPSGGSGSSNNNNNGTTSSSGSQTPEEPEIKPNTNMTYEEFQSLTAAQMRAFEESFESKEAFFKWYNAAKAKYEADNPTIKPDDDGVVDLEKK